MATWIYELDMRVRLKDKQGIFLDDLSKDKKDTQPVIGISGGIKNPTAHELHNKIPMAEIAVAKAIAEVLRKEGFVDDVAWFLKSKLRDSAWQTKIHEMTATAISTVSKDGDPDSGNISIESQDNVVVVRLGNIEFLNDQTKYSEKPFPPDHGFWYFYEVGMAPNPDWRFIPSDGEGVHEGQGFMVPTGGSGRGHPGIPPRHMHFLAWKFITHKIDEVYLKGAAGRILKTYGYELV